jgi:hypothetical protein
MMELIEVVDKEKENTQKKLEKVLEGIARQEEKDKGVSAKASADPLATELPIHLT